MEDVSFDAADLADAILGSAPSSDPARPAAASPPVTFAPPRAGGGLGLGWVLLVALIVTIAVAISLAVQTQGARRVEPEPCGGLYDECCDRPVAPDDDDRGLFDAQDGFAADDC